MTKLKSFLVILVILLIASGAAGQIGLDDSIVFDDQPINNFISILTVSGGDDRAQQLIWPHLYHNDPMSGLPVPSLATSWELSEDGLTYTFTLREDAMWSDGTPITAADVKWTVEATQSDLVESPQTSFTGQVVAVNVIDDKTVALVLEKPNCELFSDFMNFKVLPSHRFAADFSDVMTSSLATLPDISGGPYKVVDASPGEFARFEANPMYFEGEPKIPTVVIRTSEDSAVEVQSLLAGETNFAILSSDQLDQLGSPEHIDLYMFPGNLIDIFSMNWADPENPTPAYDEDGNLVEQTPHPIFGDVRVRKAIALGYDKTSIVETVGSGIRTASFVSPTVSWAYNSELELYSYDPEQAAALLDEAGWVLNEATGIREKDGMPLEFEIMLFQGSAWQSNMVLVAQDQLSQLGMNISVAQYEGGVWLERLLGQEYDIALYNLGSFSSPSPSVLQRAFMTALDVPGTGINTASYINPELEAVLNQALTVPGCDLEQRAALYQQAQAMAYEDVAYDFLDVYNVIYAINSRIKNANPGPWYRWSYNIHLWEIDG